jgi:hypothetical protein
VQSRSTAYSPNPVREGAVLHLTLNGVAGDRVALVIAPATVSTFAPQWNGQQMFPPASRFVRLTTLPNGQPLPFGLLVPDLGAGVSSRTLFFQTLFRGAGGQFVLGSEAPVVMLDASY